MWAHLVDAITGFICWINGKRILNPNDQNPKVNIGCGLSVAPGWINIDASLNAFFSKSPTPLLKLTYRLSGANRSYSENQYVSTLKGGRFVQHNLRYGLPFPDQSINYVYTSHFLGYVRNLQAQNLLKEVYRVLKQGGVARICVLDLKHVVSLYHAGKTEQFLAYFFSESGSGTLSCRKYMYDFNMLEKLLKEIGFVNIRRFGFREGKTPDIEILDNRPEETLYLEADK